MNHARAPDEIPDNIEFVAQELLEARADQRPAMLEDIARTLTKRLLQDNPGIGIREVSERVTAFVSAVRARLELAVKDAVPIVCPSCPHPLSPPTPYRHRSRRH